MDLRKQVLYVFGPLRTKRAATGKWITFIAAKRVGLENKSTSEKIGSKGLTQCTKVALPLTVDWLNSSDIRIIDSPESSIPSRAQQDKILAPPTLGLNDPSSLMVKDVLRMAWDLNWSCILKELAQASHITAALGCIQYESHDLEAQLKL
ncbi:hypothetical protein F0562_010659 [Nyssa sinensis]|uniref:Uncharacterized protein n=1 Tax=Nyssa sinensis TaxID=561372 RepID=A0A5J5A2E6_9ASTE|nr:hypothetical protein F0562_010659 [Nyssa sinensis]